MLFEKLKLRLAIPLTFSKCGIYPPPIVWLESVSEAGSRE